MHEEYLDTNKLKSCPNIRHIKAAFECLLFYYYTSLIIIYLITCYDRYYSWSKCHILFYLFWITMFPILISFNLIVFYIRFHSHKDVTTL